MYYFPRKQNIFFLFLLFNKVYLILINMWSSSYFDTSWILFHVSILTCPTHLFVFTWSRIWPSSLFPQLIDTPAANLQSAHLQLNPAISSSCVKLKFSSQSLPDRLCTYVSVCCISPSPIPLLPRQFVLGATCLLELTIKYSIVLYLTMTLSYLLGLLYKSNPTTDCFFKSDH